MKKHLLILVLVIASAAKQSVNGQVIAAGSNHSLALCSSGDVNAWGENSTGQLGVGDTPDRYVPIAVSSLTGMAVVIGGWNESFSIRTDGTLWGWGTNTAGQLGIGTVTPGTTTPVQVSSLSGIIGAAAGRIHS